MSKTTKATVTVIYVVEIPGKGTATVTTGNTPFVLEVPDTISPQGVGSHVLLDHCTTIQETAERLRDSAERARVAKRKD